MEYFELRHPRIVKRIGDKFLDVQGNVIKLSQAEFELMYVPVAEDAIRRVLGSLYKADCSEYQRALQLYDAAQTSSFLVLRLAIRTLFIVVLILLRGSTPRLCRLLIDVACRLAVRSGYSLNLLIMENNCELWEELPASEKIADATR